MDIVAASALSSRVAVLCTKVITTISQWMKLRKVIDEQSHGFMQEVSALRQTSEDIGRSLQNSATLEAISMMNKDIGGSFWDELFKPIADCEKLLDTIIIVLQRLTATSNTRWAARKLLRKPLGFGELVEFREQVVISNLCLQSLLQITTIARNLGQRELTVAEQSQREEDLISLSSCIERIAQSTRCLTTPRSDDRDPKLTSEKDLMSDNTTLRGVKSYIENAEKFLFNAFNALSALSAPTMLPEDKDKGQDEIKIKRIGPRSQHDMLRSLKDSDVASLLSDSELVPVSYSDVMEDYDKDNEIDSRLLQVLLEHGHSEVDVGNYAKAEDYYREALCLSLENYPSPSMLYATADITLMLGGCLVRQEKYDEALDLLQSIAYQTSHSSTAQPTPSATSQVSRSEDPQALSACHLLAEVYSKTSDYVNAEKHAVQAFEGRKKLLGEKHPKTQDSATLVINMYEASGNVSLAKAYRDYLNTSPAAILEQRVTADSPLPEVIQKPTEPGFSPVWISEATHDAVNPTGSQKSGQVNCDQISDVDMKYGQRSVDQSRASTEVDSGYISMKSRTSKSIQYSQSRATKPLGIIPPLHVDTEESDCSDSMVPFRADVVESFSRQLVSDLAQEKLTHEQYEQTFSEIEIHLLDFATSLALNSSSTDLLNAAKFIYQHKSILSKSIKKFCHQNRHGDGEGEWENRFSVATMTPLTKMEMWQERISSNPELPLAQDNLSYDDVQELNIAESFSIMVYKTMAYKWLVTSLRKRVLLSFSDSNQTKAIQETIFKALSRSDVTRRNLSVPVFNAVFEVEWPLMQFLDDQWPNWQDDGWMGDVVTITGDPTEAQALTAEGYIEQTWPITGPHLLRLLDKVLRNKKPVECKELEELQLKACIRGESVSVEVEGARGLIMEVGEQLCWLASAMKAVPTRGTSCHCIPSVHVTSQMQADSAIGAELSKHLSDVDSSEHPKFRLHRSTLSRFQIEIRCIQIDPGETEQGRCWRSMFGSFVIVKGFPILRRARSKLGLEISLNIAAALLRTKYVSHFNQVSYLKSFSAILSPSNEMDDMAIWHLNVARDENGIRYSDYLQPSYQFGKPPITYSRHVVGWSQHARNYMGSADCSYDIGPTNARQVSTKDALHGCILTPIEPIPSAKPFHILKDQYPDFHVTQELPRMMRRLNNRFVCFWDVLDQRAWLANGVGALAHLVRASIECDKEQTALFSVLQPDQLEEPGEPHSFDAADQFLCNAKNQQAVVLRYPHKGGSKVETFEDRVVQLYHILDSAFSYYEGRRKALKRSARGTLEGWNFRDLIWYRDDSHKAHRFRIGHGGRGWVDMLRDIGALTLSGSGFGELIEPVPNKNLPLCSDWASLPSGRSYLATPTRILKQIMLRNGGSIHNHPRRLTKSLSWIAPTASFECSGYKTSAARTDHVQIVWPTKQLSQTNDIKQMEKMPCDIESVVIFGFNELHRWHLPDHGPPIEGIPQDYEGAEEISDPESSSDETESDQVPDILHSQTMSSPETSITEPIGTTSQSGRGNNSYGNSKVYGHARQICGNVYNIVNNHNVSAVEVGAVSASTDLWDDVESKPVSPQYSVPPASKHLELRPGYEDSKHVAHNHRSGLSRGGAIRVKGLDN